MKNISKFPLKVYKSGIYYVNNLYGDLEDILKTLRDYANNHIVSSEDDVEFELIPDGEQIKIEISIEHIETKEEVKERRSTICEQKKMAARARIANKDKVEQEEKELLAKLIKKYGVPNEL